jgi:hypothetical protein
LLPCRDCLNLLRKQQPDRYAVFAEALMFAYLQRDEAKIAKRLGQFEQLLEGGRCPVHARPEPSGSAHPAP